MNLQTRKQQLLDCKSKLSMQWHKVQEVWQDEQAHFFYKTYLEKLERELKVSLEAMDALDEIFKQIEEECFK